MLISKNKIKHLTALKVKKFRMLHQQYLIEGEKIVGDVLRNSSVNAELLVATSSWLRENQNTLNSNIKEVLEADETDLSRITSLETPPPVIAILSMKERSIDQVEVAGSVSIALDCVQDPGNLGTIIRTADWFGIRNVFCTPGCADIYNPKVIQASMGSVVHTKVHYVDLQDLLKELSELPGYIIAGTFMQGDPVQVVQSMKKGLVIFGNESRGISGDFFPYIKQRITIPAGTEDPARVESLNVASSVAIVLSRLRQG
jgi:RNA methyltransferase, TrmH family